MRTAFRALLLLVSLVAAAPSRADDDGQCGGRDLSAIAGLADAKAKRADDLINGDGLLWRIEKPGLPVSWLFGTAHTTDAGAVALARRAAEKLAEVKVAATELGAMDDLERANLSAMTLKAALDPGHDTFEPIPAPDRPAVEKLLAALGTPPEFAHRLKLWFLAAQAATPVCVVKHAALDSPEVDLLLADAAKDAGLRVVALETAAEQIDAIAAMGPDLTATLLVLAARDPQLNDDIYATLIALYLQSRPADILAVADIAGAMTDKERAAQDEFTRRLLIGRNAVMVERARPLLDEGAFIAVGALHLSGRDGLIERLRREGFTVTREW